MPSEPSAEVVFQDGWATIRMQMREEHYRQMKYHLQPTEIWTLLHESEREKHDRSEIMTRFDDNPKIGD